ncbi:hypothetical protein PG985_009448 [Apiospora marii]|uniref:uncharacterized protein n=1 Tax=Apiospora marii TaxID=335849 RepID=UPI00312CEB37
MFILVLAILLGQTLGLAVADVIPNSIQVDNVDMAYLPFPSRQLFQFEQNGTWIENVAARSNGDLLFTVLQPAPQLYSMSAVQSKEPQVTLLFEFPDMTGVLGITEASPDVFVVAGGKFTGTATPVFGTFSLWRVSFADAAVTCKIHCGWSGKHPSFTKLLNLPDNVYPNGLTSVPDKPGVIFVADSMGSLLRVDVTSGKIEAVAAVPEMAPVQGWPFLMGINGIKIHDGYVYWTNSFAATMYRMAIDADGYAVPAPSSSSYSLPDTTTTVDVAAPKFTATLESGNNNSTNVTVETVVSMPITFMDDFAIAENGTLWITTNPNNTVIAYNEDTGMSAVVAGDQHQETMAGANAAVFGRTDSDSHMLYVVTAGGLTSPVNGSFVEPAKVVAIDTTHTADEGR